MQVLFESKRKLAEYAGHAFFSGGTGVAVILPPGTWEHAARGRLCDLVIAENAVLIIPLADSGLMIHLDQPALERLGASRALVGKVIGDQGLMSQPNPANFAAARSFAEHLAWGLRVAFSNSQQ